MTFWVYSHNYIASHEEHKFLPVKQRIILSMYQMVCLLRYVHGAIVSKHLTINLFHGILTEALLRLIQETVI